MIQLKCPICGKPVPASKGVKPRKYCSLKCSQMASQLSSKQRGYKRPKNFRKVCALCGEVFFAERQSAVYCSQACACNAINMRRYGKSSSARSQAILDRRERKRLALENCVETAAVTIEERGGIVTEWRGQRVIGARAVGLVKHL